MEAVEVHFGPVHYVEDAVWWFVSTMGMRLGESGWAYPSMSPSTRAKNLVISTESVFMVSLRASRSETMLAASRMSLERTLSPRSQTATLVAWRSCTCETACSE